MTRPDWRDCPLEPGILREPSPDTHRLVVWVPPGRGEDLWERVASVPGSEAAVAPELSAAAAVAIRARRASAGLFRKLLGRFRAADGVPRWVMPNGASAEQVGERQTDLLLVWSENEQPVDERVLESHWPESRRRQKLGKNLFLIDGVAPAAPPALPAAPAKGAVAPTKTAAPTPRPSRSAKAGNPRQQAEQAVAEAQRSGDPQRQATALADLGAVFQRTGDARNAVVHLEAALPLARQVGDQALESDILGNLALSVLALGQPGQALQLVGESLEAARASEDHYQIKFALDVVGDAYSGLRDPAHALEAYDEAISLARNLGDRQHQAKLLWCTAIQYADLGHRAEAIASARASIDILQSLGTPHLETLTGALKQYESGEAAAPLSAAAPAASGVLVGGWSEGGPAAAAPSPLRMAFTAAKAFGKFLASGLKTVPAAVRDERLAICGACQHHTGVRCRLCGCFTSAKTWLPHEQCPIEKWKRV